MIGSVDLVIVQRTSHHHRRRCAFQEHPLTVGEQATLEDELVVAEGTCTCNYNFTF